MPKRSLKTLPVSFKMSVALEQANWMYTPGHSKGEYFTHTQWVWANRWIDMRDDERMMESIGYVFH